MHKKLNKIFSTKRAFVFAGILILICAVGVALLAQRFRKGTIIPGSNNSIPVVNDANQPRLSDGLAGTQTDQFGIRLELSDGQPQPATADVFPLATGEPLAPDEIESILSRLPALPLDSDDQATLNLPQDVLPPPRPGETIKEPFPPLDTEPTPGAVDAGPLQVLRFAPEGEIPIAPFVSVTFNQPMVPLGTLSDLVTEDLPLQIEPALPGTWRWLGTRTLNFEYDSELIERLPKATEYRVTVPAGIKSISGESLAEAVTWTFKTPPPKVVAR